MCASGWVALAPVDDWVRRHVHEPAPARHDRVQLAMTGNTFAGASTARPCSRERDQPTRILRDPVAVDLEVQVRPS